MTSIMKCLKISSLILSRNANTTFKKHSVLLLNNLIQNKLQCPSYVTECQKKVDSCETDLSQALTSFKYLRLIKKAVREFGPIVEENKKLELLLENANRLHLPQDMIDLALRISVDTRAKIGLFELLFHHQGHFIVQFEDIDRSLTKHNLLKLCDKSDANLIQGSIKWPGHFVQKGIISVQSDDSPFSCLEEAESAIKEALSDSVKSVMDAEGYAYWQFHCDPDNLHEAKRQLIGKGCQIEEAHVGYVPINKLSVPSLIRSSACSIMKELSEVPTIDNVYTNIV